MHLFPSITRRLRGSRQCFYIAGDQTCCCFFSENTWNQERKAALAKHHIPQNSHVKENILLSHRKPATYSYNRNRKKRDKVKLNLAT